MTWNKLIPPTMLTELLVLNNLNTNRKKCNTEMSLPNANLECRTMTLILVLTPSLPIEYLSTLKEICATSTPQSPSHWDFQTTLMNVFTTGKIKITSVRVSITSLLLPWIYIFHMPCHERREACYYPTLGNIIQASLEMQLQLCVE